MHRWQRVFQKSKSNVGIKHWFGEKIKTFKYFEVVLAVLDTPGASHIWR